MHSIIFQIGTKPFNDESELDPDAIADNPKNRNLLDYAYEVSEKVRAINIRILVETILPIGMFDIDTENNLIYKGGFNSWREEYYESVMKCTKSLTPANIMGEGRKLLALNKAILNPLKTAVLFECGNGMVEQSLAVMSIVEHLEIGDFLYIGSVLGYHD